MSLGVEALLRRIPASTRIPNLKFWHSSNQPENKHTALHTQSMNMLESIVFGTGIHRLLVEKVDSRLSLAETTARVTSNSTVSNSTDL
jgi:hypothetical protein